MPTKFNTAPTLSCTSITLTQYQCFAGLRDLTMMSVRWVGPLTFMPFDLKREADDRLMTLSLKWQKVLFNPPELFPVCSVWPDYREELVGEQRTAPF